MATHATAAFHQAVAIEHGMDGAFGGDFDIGESADQALSDLTSAPAGVLALHIEDVVLNLKRELMGIPIGTPAPVGQTLNPALLVAIEELIPSFAGDPELSAEFRHGLAGEPQTEAFHPSPNTPSTASHSSLSLPHEKGKKCRWSQWVG